LTFHLQGRDGLSPVLRGAGASAGALRRDLDDVGAQGAQALGNLGASAGQAGAALGPQAGGLSWGMGVAAVAALSALPALGALVPLMAGVAVGAATLKMGFAGVGDAMAASEQGAEEYQEALKKLPAPAREFTKELVGLKKEFAGIGKEVQAAMLPGFTSALRAADPLVKTVRGSMVDLAGTFGDAARDFGKLMQDSGFQKDFAATLKLGNTFVRDLTGSMRPFIQSLVHFGAVSGPTLKAFSDGISGLLSSGLPGFFKGLEPGIQGSAAMFRGFFDALNTVLPALGRFSGAAAEAFGPLLGSGLRVLGDLAAMLMDALTPAIRELTPATTELGKTWEGLPGAVKPFVDLIGKGLAFAVRNVVPIFQAAQVVAQEFLSVLGNLAGAVIPAFTGALSDSTSGMATTKDFAAWVSAHRTDIREFFNAGADAAMGFVIAVGENLPGLYGLFSGLARVVLGAFGVIIHGAESAFGWIPGIGGKIKGAADAFDTFRGQAEAGLDAAGSAIENFSENVTPRLKHNRLQMNITNWTENINNAREQLKDKNLPPGKRAKLTADIKDWTAKRRDAEQQLRQMKADKTAKLRGDKSDFDRKVGAVEAKKMPTKTAMIKADAGSFWATVGSIAGRVLGTATVRVVASGASKVLDLLGLAQGGLVGFASGGPVLPGYPSGGLLRGPGTGTSDSILARVSNGEYVVKAAAVDKYGVKMFDDLNAMRLPAPTRQQPTGTASAARYATAAAAGSPLAVDVHVHFDDPALKNLIDIRVQPRVDAALSNAARELKVGLR
jgi:hypothetical protein